MEAREEEVRAQKILLEAGRAERWELFWKIHLYLTIRHRLRLGCSSSILSAVQVRIRDGFNPREVLGLIVYGTDDIYRFRTRKHTANESHLPGLAASDLHHGGSDYCDQSHRARGDSWGKKLTNRLKWLILGFEPSGVFLLGGPGLQRLCRWIHNSSCLAGLVTVTLVPLRGTKDCETGSQSTETYQRE